MRPLRDHLCSTVQGQGWGGIKNGELLQLAEGEFDLFIQNLTGRRIAILELSTNDVKRIQAASSLLEAALENLQPNDFRQLLIP